MITAHSPMTAFGIPPLTRLLYVLGSLYSRNPFVTGFFVGWYFVKTPPYNLSMPDVIFLCTTGS